jgi:hypothetical protein
MMCGKQGKSWPKLRSSFLQLGSIFCMYVGYQTNKFTLLVTPLTVLVRTIFTFIFGNVIFYW